MMHKVICFLALAIVFNLEGQPPSDPRSIRDFYKEYNYYGEPLNRQPRLYGEIDKAITDKIRSTLLGDSSLSYDAQHITIETHNGNVTLRGHVEDLEEKNRLTEIVTFINGVQSVDNRLQVSYGY